VKLKQIRLGSGRSTVRTGGHLN